VCKTISANVIYITYGLLNWRDTGHEGDGLSNRFGHEKQRKWREIRRFTEQHRTKWSDFEMTKPMGMMTVKDEWLTIEEVASRMGKSVTEVYSLTRKRREARGLLRLPHRKSGRRLVFNWPDVVRWLNAQPGYELPTGGESNESLRVF
jgi:hypothetical protein